MSAFWRDGLSGRGMASNVALLTQSHTVVKAKKRQKLGRASAVVFDEDARREFLTGFHKRKLAKKEESKKRAQAREKEERLEARREQRRVLAEQAAQNAAKVEEAYGGFVQHVESDQESWTGIASPSSSVPADQHEYSDEEQLATVTVVEDFDPSMLLYHPAATNTTTTSDVVEPPAAERQTTLLRSGGKASRNLPVTEPAKKARSVRERVVRYETKAARRATRTTQRARRTEKAELAGGKAARKKAGGKNKPRARK